MENAENCGQMVAIIDTGKSFAAAQIARATQRRP
jgi:hypothetical protein